MNNFHTKRLNLNAIPLSSALWKSFQITRKISQSLEDQTVTLRERDTMQQERIAIERLKKLIVDKVSLTSLLQQL